MPGPEVLKLWAAECAEWQAIRDEMLDARPGGVTAFQVSLEQRRRMLARGQRPLDPRSLAASTP